jgi:hypothetical protein
MAPPSRLNARLLVGRDHKIVRVERLALPYAGVQIQNTSSAFRKCRIARKDPAPVTPWFDGVGVKPAPDGYTADGCNQAALQDNALHLRNRELRQRQPKIPRCSTGDSFYLHYDAGGKAGWAPATRLGIQAAQPVAVKALTPFGNDLPRQIDTLRDRVILKSLSRKEDNLGSNNIAIR